MFNSLIAGIFLYTLIAAIFAISVLAIGYKIAMYGAISIVNFLDKDIFGITGGAGGEWKSYHSDGSVRRYNYSSDNIFPSRRKSRRRYRY